MQKVLLVTIVISLSIGLPIVAIADTYDDFMKTKIAEFRSTPGDEFKCRHKKIEKIEGDFKTYYDLCILRGKPVTLHIYTDETSLGISNYRNGKLVHMALSEFGDGVGFRNGQPVVEWHYGEYGQRGVTWKISPKDKTSYLASAAQQRRVVLKLFGISIR